MSIVFQYLNDVWAKINGENVNYTELIIRKGVKLQKYKGRPPAHGKAARLLERNVLYGERVPMLVIQGKGVEMIPVEIFNSKMKINWDYY